MSVEMQEFLERNPDAGCRFCWNPLLHHWDKDGKWIPCFDGDEEAEE